MKGTMRRRQNVSFMGDETFLTIRFVSLRVVLAFSVIEFVSIRVVLTFVA